MLLTVCIEAGRSTLTHTSWTGLAPVSRKWMSGQAAALAATQDRTSFANLSATCPLRDLALPSVRRPPSPLDFYLSWMSPAFVPGFSTLIHLTNVSEAARGKVPSVTSFPERQVKSGNLAGMQLLLTPFLSNFRVADDLGVGTC
jgi:hypothetical protein